MIMESETTQPRQLPGLARRVFRLISEILGVVAGILTIYVVGKDEGWWNYLFALSPQEENLLWTIAVGLGAPYTLILGSIASSKIAEFFTKDRTMTALVIRISIEGAFFIAILHGSYLNFGIEIKPEYLNSIGFAKAAGPYLFGGVGIGILVHMGVNT